MVIPAEKDTKDDDNKYVTSSVLLLVMMIMMIDDYDNVSSSVMRKIKQIMIMCPLVCQTDKHDKDD